MNYNCYALAIMHVQLVTAAQVILLSSGASNIRRILWCWYIYTPIPVFAINNAK
jgi:hypothetical protein